MVSSKSGMAALGSDFAFAHFEALVDNQNLLDVCDGILLKQLRFFNFFRHLVAHIVLIATLRFILPLVLWRQ